MDKQVAGTLTGFERAMLKLEVREHGQEVRTWDELDAHWAAGARVFGLHPASDDDPSELLSPAEAMQWTIDTLVALPAAESRGQRDDVSKYVVETRLVTVNATRAQLECLASISTAADVEEMLECIVPLNNHDLSAYVIYAYIAQRVASDSVHAIRQFFGAPESPPYQALPATLRSRLDRALALNRESAERAMSALYELGDEADRVLRHNR